MSMVIGSGGVRILRPFRSAGFTIGRLLLVIWRMPLSHQPRGTIWILAKRCASSSPIGPSSTLKAAALSANKKGRPSAASSGISADVEPWLLTVMLTAPVRRLVSSDCSFPSCSDPATRTLMFPPDLSLANSAKRSVAMLLGFPGAALWPRVRLVAAWAPRGKVRMAGVAKAPARRVRREIVVFMSVFLLDDARWPGLLVVVR